MRTKFLLLINMISDIDECDKGTHSCNFNAVCNNTKGSYNCTCKPGYEEDGDNCTGIFFSIWSFCTPTNRNESIAAFIFPWRDGL